MWLRQRIEAGSTGDAIAFTFWVRRLEAPLGSSQAYVMTVTYRDLAGGIASIHSKKLERNSPKSSDSRTKSRP